MTEAQRSALTWAIETAKMKAVVAAQTARKSATRFGHDHLMKQADKMHAHAAALKQILDGGGNG